MRQMLNLHPSCRCDAVVGIEVDIARAGNDLLLHYSVSGIADLVIPPVANCARADELWRHTCFEAFLHASSGEAYYELNFSPSTEWAAYHFTSYRHAMRTAEEIEPRIEVGSSPDRFELASHMALRNLTDLADSAVWKIGLCAVIEERNGRLSYWALAHPPEKPDFHHDACFALELPGP